MALPFVCYLYKTGIYCTDLIITKYSLCVKEKKNECNWGSEEIKTVSVQSLTCERAQNIATEFIYQNQRAVCCGQIIQDLMPVKQEH